MSFDAKNYPRDLVGYGRYTPDNCFPNGAKIAVQFVINYEEGGENCILHGDQASEAFLSEIIGAPAMDGVRHMSMESIYEYGSRSGFSRLYRMFTERNLPVTVYGVATALEKNPDVVKAMLDADWEIASHAYKWINYQYIDKEEERKQMAQAIDLHTKVTGSRPQGWYTGRTSPNTRDLVYEAGGFVYDSDSYADDLPYWVTDYDEPYLIVPYTLDTNDMRFATTLGFITGEHFFTYLKDAFDVLYAEGNTAPKMLNIGLHCRLIGRPGRAQGLARFLDYISEINDKNDDVWITRRIDIAQHWHKEHAL